MNSYPTNIFCVQKTFLFTSTAYVIMQLYSIKLTMEANTMNPNQTAPKSDLVPYCLQYRLQ